MVRHGSGSHRICTESFILRSQPTGFLLAGVRWSVWLSILRCEGGTSEGRGPFGPWFRLPFTVPSFSGRRVSQTVFVLITFSYFLDFDDPWGGGGSFGRCDVGRGFT